ncbi:hypothetical protein L2E82_39121 [Cichorium intybus]|uniref:Uncharacterized protein n=1 Tax=Cichorium intybus TaxID=13427 RepID=A0ACB9AIM8_CICIN|nr:hypothetical protein L2E82_39121 [Cichorium intybus]
MSVSGKIPFRFGETVEARFETQSFSGEIPETMEGLRFLKFLNLFTLGWLTFRHGFRLGKTVIQLHLRTIWILQFIESSKISTWRSSAGGSNTVVSVLGNDVYCVGFDQKRIKVFNIKKGTKMRA